jgi:LAS superfamily LD-carboxypeptidase LdcB
MSDLNFLVGKSKDHITFDPQFEKPIHKQTATSFIALQSDARKRGFDIGILSGFRDFDLQLQVWNRKVNGQSEILNAHGEPWDRTDASGQEIYEAITRWIAVPGSSRHHWGTDIDIFDRSSVTPDYKVRLEPSEFATTGPFGPFSKWLTNLIENGKSHGFFRPYDIYRGGVAVEPWHLSYGSVSSVYLDQFDLDTFRNAIQNSEVLLKKEILENIESYFNTHIKNVAAS